MKHADIIKKMTLEEKVALGSGLGYWQTKSYPEHGIPSIFLADGPHGLRKQETAGDHLGLDASVSTTCFPTASALAASWDIDLLRAVGNALGKEALKIGVNVILGPGVNMKRNPLCGRNFEYYSEDPYLTGKLAAAWINGVQQHKVGVSMKHFACNSQETRRMASDSLVDERALREYYLPAFEIAVKEAQPTTLMCAYNRLNGTYCSDHKWLLTDILRDEWGFDGLVVTDWGAMHDRIESIKAGLELEMPDSKGRFDAEVIVAVRSGTLDEALIDRMVDRILTLIDCCPGQEASHLPPDLFDQHHQLARRIAADCAVLLKNEDSILPLARPERVNIIGAFAKAPRYQGTGSSQVTPTQRSSVLDGFTAHNVPYRFAQGYTLTDSADEALAQEALELAKGTDPLIYCIGLTEPYESEGFDRATLSLPQNQLDLLGKLAALNQNIIVLLIGGAAMEMPWLGQAKAVLHMHLGGQAVGLAAADLLLGHVNPSGKLAETYPLAYEDVISSSYYTKVPEQVPYYESMFSGYRYFDSASKPVLFPFGYGLSYTTFAYRDLSVKQTGEHEAEARLLVRNTGTRDGAEVVQLYVAPQTDGVYRPAQELRAFSKVFLKAGEEKEVTLSLTARSFAVYNDKAKAWQVEAGAYEICVGASSRDIRLTQTLTLPGVPAVKSACDPWYYTFDGIPGKQAFESIYGPYTDYTPPTKGTYSTDSSLKELTQTSLLARMLFKIVEKQVAKFTNKGLVDYDNPQFKMLMDTAANSPIRALAQFMPDVLSIHQARGLVDIANGKLIKGVMRLFQRNKIVK